MNLDYDDELRCLCCGRRVYPPTPPKRPPAARGVGGRPKKLKDAFLMPVHNWESATDQEVRRAYHRDYEQRPGPKAKRQARQKTYYQYQKGRTKHD